MQLYLLRTEITLPHLFLLDQTTILAHTETPSCEELHVTMPSRMIVQPLIHKNEDGTIDIAATIRVDNNPTMNSRTQGTSIICTICKEAAIYGKKYLDHIGGNCFWKDIKSDTGIITIDQLDPLVREILKIINPNVWARLQNGEYVHDSSTHTPASTTSPPASHISMHNSVRSNFDGASSPLSTSSVFGRPGRNTGSGELDWDFGINPGVDLIDPSVLIPNNIGHPSVHNGGPSIVPMFAPLSSTSILSGPTPQVSSPVPHRPSTRSAHASSIHDPSHYTVAPMAPMYLAAPYSHIYGPGPFILTPMSPMPSMSLPAPPNQVGISAEQLYHSGIGASQHRNYSNQMAIGAGLHLHHPGSGALPELNPASHIAQGPLGRQATAEDAAPIPDSGFPGVPGDNYGEYGRQAED